MGISKLLLLDPDFKPAFDGLKLAKIVIAKLSRLAPLVEVYLFGSAAEGKNTVDSDLDILVVIPNDRNIREYYSIVNQGRFSPVAVDWIFKTKAEFEIARKSGGVSFVAHQTGVKIFPDDSK